MEGKDWAWEIQCFLFRSNTFPVPLSSILTLHTEAGSPNLYSRGGNHSLTSHLTGVGNSPRPLRVEEPESGFLDHSLFQGPFCQNCQLFLLIRVRCFFHCKVECDNVMCTQY